MSMKGWIASLTLKNYPSVDIFGLNPETDSKVSIQVKTIRGHKSFPLSILKSNRDKIDTKIKGPFAFVHIDKYDNVRYFILSREELINIIITTDDNYANKPRVKPLADYPLAISLKDLEKFENKWESIWN